MAVKKVKKGDIILEAEPFAYALDSECQSDLCDNCFNGSTKLWKCGLCEFVKYCSKNCQRIGWKMHKRECHFIQGKKPDNETLFFARIILRLQIKNAKPDATKGLVSETKIKNFWDLKSHAEDIRKDETYLLLIYKQYLHLKLFFGEKFQTTEEEFFQIFCRAKINSFEIRTNVSVGTALYLIPSAFDHSCKRNTMSKNSGTKIIFRSTIDWRKFDPTKIRVSYLKDPELTRTAERRKKLKEKYYFWCECELCIDVERDQNMSSIRCGNRYCDAAVYVDMDLPKEAPIGKCPKCSFNSFNSNTRQEYYKLVHLIETALQKEDYKSLMKVIEKQGKICHKLNVYMLKALVMLPIEYKNRMGFQYVKQMDKAMRYYCEGVETDYKLYENSGSSSIEDSLDFFSDLLIFSLLGD